MDVMLRPVNIIALMEKECFKSNIINVFISPGWF